MISKILKTRGKASSGRFGHTKPHIIVEKPRNLPVPITISFYNPNNAKVPKKGETVVNFFPKSVRWRSKKKLDEPPPKRLTPICRWYRRRRALYQLEKEHERERKEIKRRKQEEFERERLKDFERWEQLKSQSKKQYEPPPEPYIPPSPVYVPPRLKSVQKQRVLYIKETPTKPCKKKSFTRKPCKTRKISKAVTVKKYNTSQTITNKFVNYCYRLCCQFYCYLTCIILIIFSVVCLV